MLALGVYLSLEAQAKREAASAGVDA